MNYQTSNQKYRNFGIFVGILFPLIIGLIIPFLQGHHFKTWTLFIGIPLFILAVFKPHQLRKTYDLWISLGNILGFINSRIILGSIFFLLLMPISLIMKTIGYDPLRRRKFREGTYREIRKDDNINLEKIF